MSVERPAAVAAPTNPGFVVAYVGWSLAASAAVAVAAQRAGLSSSYFHPELYALVPLLLLFTAPWAGRATGPSSLLGRSALAHALSTIVPSVLVSYLRVQSPGASGHGGLFFLLVFLVPTAAIFGSLLGLVAGLTAFAVARRSAR